MNKYYSAFGIQKIFMNEYYSVFGNFSWTNTIRYSEILHEQRYSLFGQIHYLVQLWSRLSGFSQIQILKIWSYFNDILDETLFKFQIFHNLGGGGHYLQWKTVICIKVSVNISWWGSLNNMRSRITWLVWLSTDNIYLTKILCLPWSACHTTICSLSIEWTQSNIIKRGKI